MKELNRQARTAILGGTLAAAALLTAYATARPTGETAVAMDASATTVDAAGARWDLPVKRTDRVAYWEGLLTGKRRGKMKQWLEQSGRYVPMIQRELQARGMPEDLVYLAFIESGFSPDAYSRTAAVGLWQFMEGTGKEMGLKVTPFVDERRDPLAATDAALDFLQDLHQQFGSWWLAAAAYNCGPGRVSRIMRQVTGNVRGDDESYWRISSYLPKETQDYVPLMIAAGEIAKSPEVYGFTDLDYHLPLRFDTVRVPGGTRLATVSKATGADSAIVDQLNPHYVRNVTPPVKASLWSVRIPEGLTQAFVTNFPHLFRLQRDADARAAEIGKEKATAARRAALAKRRAQAKRGVHRTRRTSSRHHAAKSRSSARRHRR